MVATLPEVVVTPAAEKFMRRMVRFSDHPAGGFRLTVTPGGCSGLASEFAVEPEPRAGDADMLVGGGLRLFLPPQSRLMLRGVTVDYAESPTRGGLVFVTPDAAACGCASSDAAEGPALAAVPVASVKRVARA